MKDWNWDCQPDSSGWHSSVMMSHHSWTGCFLLQMVSVVCIHAYFWTKATKMWLRLRNRKNAKKVAGCHTAIASYQHFCYPLDGGTSQKVSPCRKALLPFPPSLTRLPGRRRRSGGWVGPRRRRDVVSAESKEKNQLGIAHSVPSGSLQTRW